MERKRSGLFTVLSQNEPGGTGKSHKTDMNRIYPAQSSNPVFLISKQLYRYYTATVGRIVQEVLCSDYRHLQQKYLQRNSSGQNVE
jgi:hypothetical protein